MTLFVGLSVGPAVVALICREIPFADDAESDLSSSFEPTVKLLTLLPETIVVVVGFNEEAFCKSLLEVCLRANGERALNPFKSFFGLKVLSLDFFS